MFLNRILQKFFFCTTNIITIKYFKDCFHFIIQLSIIVITISSKVYSFLMTLALFQLCLRRNVWFEEVIEFSIDKKAIFLQHFQTIDSGIHKYCLSASESAIHSITMLFILKFVDRAPSFMGRIFISCSPI